MIRGVTIDARGTLKGLAAMNKQLVFATMNALNRTADDFNARMRRELPERFHVRQPGLIKHVAPVQLPKTQRATKTNLSAVMQTESLGRIFNPYETGIPHRQTAPDRPVIVPTRQLRHTDQTTIPRKWYPTNLGLTARKDPTGRPFFALGKNSLKHALTPQKVTKAGKVQIKGKHRTFVLDPTLHDGVTQRQHGVYVRIGPAREDIRMLWQYRRQVPRPRALQFEATAREVFIQRYGVNFRGALAHALRTAR